MADDTFPRTIGAVFGVAAIIGALLVAFNGPVVSAHRAEFMADCLKHRPQYECTAIYEGRMTP